MIREKSFVQLIIANPLLIWKLVAGLAFVALGVAIYILPEFAEGFTPGVKGAFSIMLLLYGVYRLFTFYSEYQNSKKND